MLGALQPYASCVSETAAGIFVVDGPPPPRMWDPQRGRTRRLKATILIERVHDHRFLAHRAQYASADQFRRARAGNKHRADHDIGGKVSSSMLAMVENRVRARPANS